MPADEHTHLLAPQLHNRRLSALHHDEEAHSIISSHVSKEEAALGTSTVGERLPYNDYTTIDWLHDLVRLLAYE
jgi:chloride channel 3/4/5